MAISNRTKKLTKEERDFVIQQLARNHTPTLIVAELQDEFGKTVTPQNIQQYKKRNPELIAETRRVFLASMQDIPLYEKAERIAELQKMYDDFVKLSAGLRTAEVIDVLSGLIAQIQKEVEPIKIKGEGFESNSTTNIFTFGGQFSRELRKVDADSLEGLRVALHNRIRETEESS